MTDIIAKQTVTLCRRMGWDESASPDLEVSPTRGGWAGGSSESSQSQTQSLAVRKSKSFLKTRTLATCWFCNCPVTFIYSLVIRSFQDFNKFVSFSAEGLCFWGAWRVQPRASAVEDRMASET